MRHDIGGKDNASNPGDAAHFTASLMLYHSSPADRSRRILHAFWLVLAAAPLAYMATRVIAASQNIAFWDDFDSVLAFVLRIEAGMGWREWLGRLFAVDSEHRTLTSRLIVAGLYGLTGNVNFNVIATISNLSLVALCALLVKSAHTTERRFRLGLLLAFGVFHLGHYETFFWSGSIDHHLVLLLAGGSIVALAAGTRRAFGAALILAALATFTLAQGCLAWAVGAAMLASHRRWRELALWGGVGGVVLAVFFYGYAIYPTHRVHDYSPAGLARLLRFWLALLGAPLSFGATADAPLYGVALLLLLGLLGWRRAWQREPVIMPLAVYAVAALALIAFGRLELVGPQIQSRYLVPGSLAWSLTAFLLIESWTEPARPFRLFARVLPAVIAFNLAINLRSAENADTFLWSRTFPALQYTLHGEEGHAGDFKLHPKRDTVKRALEKAAAHGIYRLPEFCVPVTAGEPEVNPDMITSVANVTVRPGAVGFEGWAMLPGRRSKPGQIRVLLQSDQSRLIFTTVSVERRDIARALKEPRWRHCGYHFVVRRDGLPREKFRIGLLIADDYGAEVKMTEHWLNLAAEDRPAVMAQ